MKRKPRKYWSGFSVQVIPDGNMPIISETFRKRDAAFDRANLYRHQIIGYDIPLVEFGADRKDRGVIVAECKGDFYTVRITKTRVFKTGFNKPRIKS